MTQVQQYDQAALEVSKQITVFYSTSFSAASRLISKDTRAHIYAIYGLVRLADEIVDTIRHKDMRIRLDELERETSQAIQTGWSPNVLVHSFAQTARKYQFEDSLIKAFFSSMRQDITKTEFNQKEYQEYIYGSAEVVGLMCLKVFVNGKKVEYQKFATSASALGSAFQKVNFLRDISADYRHLNRMYFPGIEYKNFTDKQKANIIRDIQSDFTAAKPAIQLLNRSTRYGVRLAYYYYQILLQKLEKNSIRNIKKYRIRVSNTQKLYLYCFVWIQKLLSI